MPKTRESRRTATTVFEDARFGNVVIMWKVGSAKLQLCSKGGADGGAAVIHETTIPGAKTDSVSVQAEVDKWFDALPGMIEEEPTGSEWTE